MPWDKNIWQCMKILPLELRLNPIIQKTVFLVPKFHLPVHIAKCNFNFSFNLTKNMGRIDGEAPEHR
jgi:hypothetical protein